MTIQDQLNLLNVVTFFKHYGIWYDFSENRFGNLLKILQITRLIYIVLIWPISVLSIFTFGVENCLDGTIYFAVIALMGLLQSLSLLIQKSTLQTIVFIFKKRMSNYNEIWQKEIFYNNAKIAWKFTYGYRNMLIIFVTVYLLLPVIIDTCLFFYLKKDVQLFRVPLPLLGFLGFQPQRSVLYYMLTFVSISWSINCIINHIGMIGSLCIVVFYMAIELQILCGRIKNLKLNNNNNHHPTKTHQNNDFQIKKIIKEHQATINLARLVNKLFGFPFAVQNIAESFNLCLTLFTVVYEFNKDIILVIANIGSAGLNLTLLYGSCCIGEYLQTQSELLYEEICNIPWYEQSPATRRDILMMLRQSSKLMKIDFKGKSALNLFTFMQVANSAYSYFTVLKSSMN